MPQALKEAKNKAGRRGNNEGSIYQRNDGRWCGMVTVGYKTDGKPVRKSIYGKSRQEVAKKVTALAGDVFANGYTSVSASEERNFKVLMLEWFDTFNAPNVESQTEYNRRNMLNNHIFKAFGTLDIQNVTLEKLQRFFNGKNKSGTAADSVHKMKNLLKNFFKYAVKKGFIRENPMDDVIIKIRAGSDATGGAEKALRPELRQPFINWIQENPILKPIIITSSLTGLRPQELLALEWRHVDLEQKTISVKQAVTRFYEFDESGEIIARGEKIGNTKTPKSVRDLLMPEFVVNVLSEWKNYCKERNIVSDFVFPNTKTGARRTYSGLRSALVRFVKKHNLEDEKISLYTFRHTFATILLEERENPKIVASMMGHTKVSTTLDIYSSVFKTAVYEKTARTLEGVFANYSSSNQLLSSNPDSK